MAHTNGDTLTDLERQAEARRAELAHTVDELHNRVSPGAIKADMRNYARDTGQQMLHVAEERARENPLMAAAIAAGIAYPLWRMIGKMPAPVLMIGAGLALSMRGSSSSDDHAARRSYSRRAYAGEYDDHPERGLNGGGGLKDKISDTMRNVKAKVGDAIESVRDTAASTASSTAESLSDRYRSGREAASDAAGHFNERYHRTRDDMMDTVERHPFLVGGLVFAVGSLVALSLPPTRRENRLMGEASDSVKRRTREFASEGVAQAQSAAREVVDEAVSDFKEEGLTPDMARRAARSAVENAREIGRRTIDAGTGGEAGSDSPGNPRNP